MITNIKINEGMLKNIFFFDGKKSLFLENILIFMIVLIQYFSGLKMFNF